MANKIKDLTGQKFGILQVLELDKSKLPNRRKWWICKCQCGNIKSIRQDVLQKAESCGCNNSKGEMIISQILKENNIPFEMQKTFESCRFPDTNQLARFDFYINNQYLIEFDGIQHFEYSGSGWNTKENFENIQKRDKFKNEWCIANNIPLIRIPYTKLKTLKLEDLLLFKDEYKA